MNVLFISWKDILNPAAGGAELFHHEISKRLVQKGYNVTHLVPGYKDSIKLEIIDGVRIHRIGQSTLFFYALPFVFLKQYRKSTDHLVDVFNCFGSIFNLFWFPHKKTTFLIHHIQDYLWFKQTVFPGLPNWLVPIINFFGYFIEKIQLIIYAMLFKGQVTTVSNSTKNELGYYGFKTSKIKLISEGITGEPLAKLEDSLPKEKVFTLVTIGLRKMKQPDQVLAAFNLFQKDHPESQLWIVGWGTEGQNLENEVRRLKIGSKVKFWGRVSNEQRDILIQKSTLLITTPAKEGWGIIIIEANALGTPSLGYNIPGICDALAFNNGWLSKPNPEDMAKKLGEVYKIWLHNSNEFNKIRQNALDTLKFINFDEATLQLEEIINQEICDKKQ